MIKALLIAAYLTTPSWIKAEGVKVYRLELHEESNRLYLVGSDLEKREVVIVEPTEYSMLTGRLEKVWASLNATRQGRVQLHGKARTEVDEKAGTKTDIHEDGFRYTEKLPVKTATSRPRRIERNDPPRKPSGISARQWEMQRKAKEARSAKPREVTVEHDAVTGKDAAK